MNAFQRTNSTPTSLTAELDEYMGAILRNSLKTCTMILNARSADELQLVEELGLSKLRQIEEMWSERKSLMQLAGVWERVEGVQNTSEEGVEVLPSNIDEKLSGTVISVRVPVLQLIKI